MADKVLKIEAEIAPRAGGGAQKLLKLAKEIGAAVANPKMLALQNKEYDKTIKFATQHLKITKEQAKVWKENLNTTKQQKTAIEDIGKLMERAQARLGKADFAGQEWLRRKMASSGINPITDPAGYARLQRTANQVSGNVRNRAQGDVDAVMGFAQETARQQADEKQTQRMERVAKMMAIGTGIKVAGQIAGTVGDVIWGAEQRKLQFGSQAASFAGTLYKEMIGGDISSIHAMAKDPKAMARFKEIVSDARTNSQIQQGAEMAKGAGDVVLGGAQAYLGMAMGGVGMGPVTVGVGAQQGIGGLASMGKTGMNYFAGKTEADVARTSLEALAYTKGLNPIEQMQFQELTSRQRQFAELGGMSGGIGIQWNRDKNGKKTTAVDYSKTGYGAAKFIMDNAAAGGIGNFDEALGMYEQLRGRIGERGAAHEGNFAAITTAPWSIGATRGSAMTGLTGAAGLMGGVAGASTELLNIFRKATSLGIHDSGLRTAFADAIPQLLETQSGRAYGTGTARAAWDLMEGNRQMRGPGAIMDMRDLTVAQQGMQVANQMTGGQSGLMPLDNAMLTKKYLAAKRAGASDRTAQILAAMPMNDLVMTGDTARLLSGSKDPQAVLDATRNAEVGVFKSLLPRGTTDAEAAFMYAKDRGISVEAARTAMGYVDTGAESKSMSYLGFPAALSSHGTKEQRANAEKLARLQLTNTYEGATNPQMQQHVGGALAGSEKLMQNLTELSKKWDLEGLKDVPGLVDKVAASINRLGVASATYTGTPYSGSAPVPPRVTGPAVQGSRTTQ